MKTQLFLTKAECAIVEAAIACEDKQQQMEGYDRDAVLLCKTADFGGGIQADVKLCNGDTGPWSETVWFRDGCEVALTDCGNACDYMNEESEATIDGQSYSVILLEAEQKCYGIRRTRLVTEKFRVMANSEEEAIQTLSDRWPPLQKTFDDTVEQVEESTQHSEIEIELC